MIRTQYSLTPFDRDKAQAGSLCVMVDAAHTIPDTIYNFNSTPGDNNTKFKGAGIAKYRSTGDKFDFSVNGTSYLFSSSGTASGAEAAGWKLVMGRIIESVNSSGNAVTGTQHGSTTRGADGSIVDDGITYEQKTIAIDAVNARDQFAMEALNSIISRMEEDPTTLSDDAVSHYCQQAYRYASYMMTASANARGEFEDKTASTSDAKKEAIGSLESNSDKLINNLIVSLERIQTKKTVDGNEVYAQRIDFNSLDDILTKMEAANVALTALKDNVTNAMTNMQQVMTQHLGAFNEMIAKFDLINSSIQSYTQTMTANFTTVNDNVTSLKSDISSMDTDVNNMVNEVTNLKGTTNTINTNVSSIKSDVAVIKQNTTPRID